ncbi:hypothetical protein FRC00_001056 [Tulasnella sp. 408]|nr:hypothetical protein FRC00_001056 [Tulasnella sp. 408]
MTEIQPELPKEKDGPIKRDRKKATKHCQKTVLCIPNKKTRRPLTDKDVVGALCLRRAVVLNDGDTGHYWVRPGDEEYGKFLGNLKKWGIPGYTWRKVEQGGKDWDRLLKQLLGGGASQSQVSIEEPVGSSSTTNLVDAQVEGSPTPSVVGDAEEESFESGLPETAPVGASSGEGAEGTDSGTHSTTRRERQRLRKRARLARNDALEVVPSASNAHRVRRTPPLDSGFAKLATELIMEIFQLCFEGAATTKAHYRTLKRLHNIDRRCRKILRDMPALWTKITSAYPKRWIKRALTFSQNRLLHVEAGPDRDTGSLDTFNQVLLRIKRHRDRWASLSLQFPSKTLIRVKKYLAGPAPSLEVLSLTMADAAVATGLALPMGDALRREVDSPLEILGREAGKLKRLLLSNIPCVWDPSSFTTLTDLGLVNGVRLRFDNLLAFLRGSSNLQALRLVNIKFVDGTAQLVDETISLPHLTELVLAELVEPVNLGALFLSIDAPECHRLHLDLHPSEGFIAHPVLPLRVASTVQKSPSLGDDSQSFMVFRSNRNTQSASWTSEDKAGSRRGEQRPSFNISFRSTSSGLADAFCRLVRGVRVIVGETGEIVVDVDDSLSGAIAQHPGLQLEAIVPSLSPTFFEELNVVEIRASVVNRFLQRLGRMMAPGESETWSFNALEVIRLRAIPKNRRGTMPDASDRCSLEQFIRRIRKRRYGVDRDEPVPESGVSMSIALEGRFAIEVETGELLGEGDRLWGIEINHLGGLLVYGGAEGEEDEEEAEDEEGEEEEVREDEEDDDDEDDDDDDGDDEEDEEEGDEVDEVDENDEAGEVEEVEEVEEDDLD